MASYITPDAIAARPAAVDDLDEFDTAIDPWSLDELDSGAELGSIYSAGAFADGHGE